MSYKDIILNNSAKILGLLAGFIKQQSKTTSVYYQKGFKELMQI